MEIDQTCPNCHFTLTSDVSFCPNCGIPLKVKPISTSISKQISIYLVSFFLPPLGLIWGIKYLKINDQKARRIGWIAIILTVISIIFTLMIINASVSKFNQAYRKQLEFSEF